MDAKAKRNYSFKKAASLINGIVAETLTDMARYQNEAMQTNLDESKDINDKSFISLKKSTLEIRKKRGQGTLALDTGKMGRRKKLRGLKNIPAKKSNLVSKVVMTAEYGVYHNQGFVTAADSMIPGKKVPARNWFGITKDMRPDGRKYKVYVRMTLMKIAKSLRKL